MGGCAGVGSAVGCLGSSWGEVMGRGRVEGRGFSGFFMVGREA